MSISNLPEVNIDKPCLEIRQNVNLSQMNTLGFNTCAHSLIELTDADVFFEWWREPAQAHIRTQERLILGGGSNLVLMQNLSALVIQVANKGWSEVRRDQDWIWLEVQAGEVWHDWVMFTVSQEWAGIENLALIPGTVGACPVQNIGAYGADVAHSIAYVRAFDFQSDTFVHLSAQDCGFGYRDSLFKHALWQGQARYLIVSVCFKLRHHLDAWEPNLGYGDVRIKVLENVQSQSPEQLCAKPIDVARAIIAIRHSKLPDPKVLGNAGSFFKNPVVPKIDADRLKNLYPEIPCYPVGEHEVKIAAGWLIERAGWKGKRSDSGCVGVYEKQALVLVHFGGGTGADLMQFANQIVMSVANQFGVSIEPEPIVIGV